MQVDLMDVRLDEKKLPYAVHETVGEYVGDEGVKINNPKIAVRILNEVFHMKDFAEERAYIILLAGSCDVISFAEVGRGIISCAPAGIREIMQRALLCNAARVILAHNHPELGTTPDPSEGDRKVTEKLTEACRLMQIAFSDHIIIAGDRYFSFNEERCRKQQKDWEMKRQEEQT